MPPRMYSSYAEFEREEIRPSFRIGFTLDDIEEAAMDASMFEEEGDEYLDECKDPYR